MLNLKNTLDGYLKNVEVIGNTIQDTNNLANIRSVGDKVEGQELYNISIQVDNGEGVSEVVEILSPVQLEKVGDVADKVICKDGVWGVEKHISSIILGGNEHWTNEGTGSSIDTMFGAKTLLTDSFIAPATNEIKHLSFPLAPKRHVHWSSPELEGIHLHPTTKGVFINVLVSKLENNSLDSFKKWLQLNPQTVKYQLMQPQFIPLPHDQQVKLRTFAGQTNIAFLTEIAGRIKAQVPKSLGATVNTHTEQIADLHNSLDRVKKLEETTVSTVETGSNFTTVDATSNGYFEDVKLEGKTLVNLLPPNVVGETDNYSTTFLMPDTTDLSSEYTLIPYGVTLTSSTTMTISQTAHGVMPFALKVPNVNGAFKFKCTNTEFDYSIYMRIRLNGVTVDKNVKYVLLEGDHTQNPPSYFEGLLSVGQDVEDVSVESRNRNRLHISENFDWKYGTAPKVVDNVLYGGWAIGYKVYLEKGDYVLSCNRQTTDNSTPNALLVKVKDASTNTVVTSFSLGTLGELLGNFTVPHNSEYIIMLDNQANVPTSVISDIQLCRTEVHTGYTQHQYNKKPLLYFNPTTETWEKPVLREWDTIEKHSDGKYYYHKRSGEIVLNGSENWYVPGWSTLESWISNNPNGFAYETHISIAGKSCNTPIICNKFNSKSIPNSSSLSIGYCALAENYLSFATNVQKTVEQWKSELQANPVTVVYQLAQEEVYECTNIDLMTYSGETNYIINSGAISPKSLLKVHNNISNVVKILQEKVSLLENTFIAGLKSVLSGDMYSLATILYPEDFEQNDNTEQDIVVIPE